MDVLIDLGAGCVTVVAPPVENTASLPSGADVTDEACAAVVAAAMHRAGDPQASWRLTIMAAGGARVRTAELLAAVLRAVGIPPERVLIDGPRVLDTFAGRTPLVDPGPIPTGHS